MAGEVEHTMQVLSVNVGQPREVLWHGRRVLTGIYKYPVEGSLRLEMEDFVGDRQADLTVHGGPDKAAYVYPAEYYDAWRRELPDVELPWGAFGENLTIAGVTDTAVYIGDRYQIGSAEVQAVQPRLPCYKLGLRFGRDTFVKQFLQSGRTGFYFRVLRPGEVAAGDAVILLARESHGITIADIVRLYVQERYDEDGMRRALSSPSLPDGWRTWIQERLDRLASPSV